MDYSSKCSVYYEQERAEIAPFLPRDLGVLLDVGCGRGAFGALVKRDFGSEVWGIEPNSEAAKFAISRLDRVFIREFDEHLELPADYFDVVTFNDSLEHFPYPEPPLEFCKKILKPGGKVISSIPNVRYISNVKKFLLEMDWRYEPEGILDYTHLRFFTKRSMERTFTSLGFHVDSITGINSIGRWRGKTGLLRRLIPRYMDDMQFMQFVVVASWSK